MVGKWAVCLTVHFLAKREVCVWLYNFLTTCYLYYAFLVYILDGPRLVIGILDGPPLVIGMKYETDSPLPLNYIVYGYWILRFSKGND